MRLFFTGKLIIFITLPIVILSMFALFNIKESLKEAGMEQLKAHMLELVQHYAANINSELDKSSTLTDTTALFLSTVPLSDDKKHYALLKNNLKQNNVIFGSAIAYEKGYYPGKTLFAPYVYRDKHTFAQMDIAKEAYDYTELQWTWFNGPKNQMEGTWSEPYFDEGAGNVLMITYSAPILDKEKFLGVVTVDLDIEALHETLALEGLSNSNYVILTNTGHFAFHSKKELVGKSFLNLADDMGLEQSIYIARKMITGEKGYIEVKNDLDQEEMVFFAPIGKYGWSFALSLTKENAEHVVFYDKNMTQVWLLIILIIGLLLSLYVSYYSLHKPITAITAGLDALENGENNFFRNRIFSPPFDELTKKIASIFDKQYKDLQISAQESDETAAALTETTLLLKQADKRVRGLLGSAQNSIIIINAMGEIMATNFKSESILKLKTKNMIGESILTFVDEKDKEHFSHVLNTLFSNIIEQEIEEITIVTKSNIKHQVKAILKPVFIREDEIEANIVFVKVD